MVSTGLKNHAPDATEALYCRLSRHRITSFEICEYAVDSYDAIQNSKEDVPYLKEHPHFIDYCVSEEVKKVADFMAAGIPMGR